MVLSLCQKCEPHFISRCTEWVEWEDMKQTRAFIDVVITQQKLIKTKGDVGYKTAKETDLFWGGVLPLVMCHL